MRKCLPILMILVATPLWAATYYVDYSKGNDALKGTSQADAWKHSPGDKDATDTAKSVVLAPGDVVLLKGGVIYRGSVEVPASGKEGSPVTYKGDGWGAGKAVIDGSAPIGANWTRCASADELRGNKNFEKIYWTAAPKGFGFLTGTYEGSDFIYPCQDPPPADPFHYDRTDQLRVLPTKNAAASQTDTSITDSRNFTQTDPAYYDGAYVLIWHQPNVTRTYKVTGFDPNTHTIRHEKLGGAGIYKDRDTYYAIMNHPAFLSGPGQYYHDEKAGRLYVWPRKAGSPDGNDFSVAAGEMGLKSTGKHHLLIEGFIVQKFVFGIGAEGKDASDVEIRNCEVRSLKSNDKYGIFVSGTNMKVTNNRVTDCQRAVGIIANGKDVVIKGNWVQRTSRQGIWFMGVEHCQIVGNTVVDVSGTHANGISVYLFSKDTLIAGNRVLKTGSAFTYHGNGDKTPKAEGMYVYNNIFDGAVNSWLNEMGDAVIVNNTFLDAGNVGKDLGKQVFVNNIVHMGGAGTVRSHNIYTALNWAQNPEHKWSMAEGEIDWSKKDRSELFVDLAKGDYRLKTGSAAIDAGVDPTQYLPVALFPDYDFSKDIDGNPHAVNGKWSIGACGRGEVK
jgi:hypothetical protein